MTPAILPTLLACVPAQRADVSETPGAGQDAAIDFSALLLDLLPDSAPPAEPAVIPTEARAAAVKTETRGEPEPEATAGDQPSQQPDLPAAPVLAVPVPIVLDAPAPAISSPGESEATPEGAGEVRATGATEPAGIASTPERDRQARDQGPQAAPAAAGIPLPPGFDPEATNSVATIQPDAESGVPVEQERTPADSRAAGADSAPNAPKQGPRNAEIAFAARLTAPAQAPSAAVRAPELHLAMPAEMRLAEPDAELGPEAPGAAIPEPHLAMPQEMHPAGVETERGVPPPRASAPPAPGPQQPDLNQVVQRDRAPANVRAEAVLAAGPSPAPGRAADMLSPAVEPPEARAQQAPVPRAQAQIDGDPEPQAQARAAQAEVKPRSAGSGGGTAPDQRPDRPGAGPHRVTGVEGGEAPVMHRSESTAELALRPAAPRERAAVLPAAQEVIELQPGRTEPAKPQALRELSVVLPGRASEGGKTGPQVEIRVVERTGDVQVAVRTADSRLTSSLREDLPQLVSQLADRGYRAETWHPAAAPAAGEGRPTRAGSSEPGRGGDSSGNPGRGGSDTAGRDGNGGRREQEQKQPEWLDALERSLGRDGAPIRRIL